jgi:HD superfamily phosphodiesterase
MATHLAKHIQDEQLDVSINIFVVEMAALFHDLFECVQNTQPDGGVDDLV